MANKAKVDLTKEEIGVIIDAIDLIDQMGSRVFEELNVDSEGLIARLEKVYFKLKWRDE